MTFRSPKLLAASRDQCCVRCGKTEGVVGAHYMDTISREKEKRYGHSEEFFYYIALTWERRFLQGVVVVARKGDVSDRVAAPESLPGTGQEASGLRGAAGTCAKDREEPGRAS